MRVHRSHREVPRLRWWYAMRLWERALLVVVVATTLAVSVALIIYGPSWETPSSAAQSRMSVTTTPAQMYPPGTRWYLRRGQWFPPSEPLP